MNIDVREEARQWVRGNGPADAYTDLGVACAWSWIICGLLAASESEIAILRWLLAESEQKQRNHAVTIRNAGADAEALEAELAEAKAKADAAWKAGHIVAERTFQAETDRRSPSLPVHGTPEALRTVERADDLTLEQIRSLAHGVYLIASRESDVARDWPLTAAYLHEVADRLDDRLEREQVREATHTEAIEAGARVLAECDYEDVSYVDHAEWEGYRANARALVDRGADLAELVKGEEG